jgi:hypothetical protein
MKASLHHRICARPMAVCWVLGTLFLWAVATLTLAPDGVFLAAASDVLAAILLAIGYACLSGLGFFVGNIPCYLPVARLCRWVNGGPFLVGDRVLILKGQGAGTVTTVYELFRGQAGDLLPRVDLGPEVGEKYGDICEAYELLRVAPAVSPAKAQGIARGKQGVV